MSRSKFPTRTIGRALNKINPVEALREILTAYTTYATVREQESTKRAEIARDLEIELATIRAQQEAVLAFLDRGFAERAALFREHFRLADEALERGDAQALAVVVTGIVEIAKTSPLASLADLSKTRERLRTPGSDFSV